MDARLQFYNVVLSSVSVVAISVEAIQGIFAFGFRGLIIPETTVAYGFEPDRMAVDLNLQLSHLGSAEVEEPEHVARESKLERGSVSVCRNNLTEPGCELLQGLVLRAVDPMPLSVKMCNLPRIIHAGVFPVGGKERLRFTGRR